jgi:AraC family transcriptional regulator
MATAINKQQCANSGVRPEFVHHYAPGEILAEGDTGANRRRRIFFREFRYQPSTVCAPGLNSLLLVIYREGRTLMRRRCDAPWQERRTEPGVISILAAGCPSDWEWDQPIGVSHIYLSYDLMTETAVRAFDRDYSKFNAGDRLNIQDPKLLGLANIMTAEFREPSIGGNLLIDSVAQAICLHTIRSYHNYDGELRISPSGQFLTPAQQRRALEFIDAHLSCDFDLSDLAKEAGLSPFHFTRCFKNSLGASPYQFAMRKRLERVINLLQNTAIPIAEIAFSTGFSDQSHMTRALRRAFGTTPGAIRRHDS